MHLSNTDLRSRCLSEPVTTPTSNSSPPVVLAYPRDPGYFSGTVTPDIEVWLNLYEKVSTENRWDNTIMLANVIFYLKDTTRTWTEMHETELTSWDLCKSKLQEQFVKPVDRKLLAKEALATRVLSDGELHRLHPEYFVLMPEA